MFNMFTLASVGHSKFWFKVWQIITTFLTASVYDSNSIEDELHFTLECPLYQKQRKTILDNLYIKFPNLYNLDHPNLFIWMMSNDDPVFLSAFIE
jgi:hypothetical protein